MTERPRTEAAVTAWVQRYLRAWRTNDPDDIRALFTEDAQLCNDPWQTPPLIGHDEIVADWLRRADQPGDSSFRWEIVGIDGSRGFVQGETRYATGPVYSNLWVIDLAGDGRAAAFSEWWMDQSDPS